MNYETKFSVGDKVYFVYKDWFVFGEIYAVAVNEEVFINNVINDGEEIEKVGHETHIKYFFKVNLRDGTGTRQTVVLPESDCYATKQELFDNVEIVDEFI